MSNNETLEKSLPQLETALAHLTPATATSNAALLYLSGLTKAGRRSMSYRLKAVAHLFGFPDIQAFPWHELRFIHVLAVRTAYADRGLAPRTINTTICALSGVTRMAWKLEQISYEEYARIKHVGKVKGERLPPGRALTDEEMGALFDVCARDKNQSRGRRDAALLGILRGGGLRRSEAVGLDLEDYDPRNGELRVLGKGNKERIVYLANGAKAALEDWLSVRGDEPGPLLTSTHRWGTIYIRRLAGMAVYEIIIERAQEAGIQRFMPHDLRRTYISELLDAGADLVAVSQLVGHEDTNTTAKYDRRGERAKQKAASLVRIPYPKQ
jgi:site-specific recombinase XerD